MCSWAIRAIVPVLCFLAWPVSGLSQTASQDNYRLFGSRFDWILDVYSKDPESVGDVRLFIREAGKGNATYLVIHGGFGAEHSYLLDALLPVADEGRLIFYDQRGSLRSPAPDSLITLDGHIRDIERIRKAYRIEKLNIIAHSMGSYLAMAYLQRYPANVGRMILISSLPARLSSDNIEEYSAYQTRHMQKMSAGQPSLWKQELAKRGFTGPFNADIVGQRDFVYIQQFWSAIGSVANYKNWELDNRGSTFLFNRHSGELASAQMPEFFDFTEALGRHPSAVTFVKGDGDYLSPEVVRASLEGLKNVEFLLIKKAGHNVCIEQPSEFKRVMLSAMRR
jgi:proline iminopeptidase